MRIQYKPKGTCSKLMDVEVEDGIVKHVSVVGGCDGNLKGICSLVEGMPVDAVIERLRGIHCGPRSTSCPDQLSIALSMCVEKE